MEIGPHSLCFIRPNEATIYSVGSLKTKLAACAGLVCFRGPEGEIEENVESVRLVLERSELFKVRNPPF